MLKNFLVWGLFKQAALPVDDDPWATKDALSALGSPQRGLVDLEGVCQVRGSNVERGVVPPAERELFPGREVVVDAGGHELVEGHRVVVAQVNLEMMIEAKL